jgi:peroxiredoxin
MDSWPDVGDVAPEIDLPSTEGHFNLYERLEDGPVLLVFYPKDQTLVCTRQLCNYRDNLSMFEEANVQVAGINHDTIECHEAFAHRYKFPFPLVSDAARATCNAYGALLELWKMRRLLVLVGRDGRIWWRQADLRIQYRSARELQKVIEELQRQE